MHQCSSVRLCENYFLIFNFSLIFKVFNEISSNSNNQSVENKKYSIFINYIKN